VDALAMDAAVEAFGTEGQEPASRLLIWIALQLLFETKGFFFWLKY